VAVTFGYIRLHGEEGETRRGGDRETRRDGDKEGQGSEDGGHGRTLLCVSLRETPGAAPREAEKRGRASDVGIVPYGRRTVKRVVNKIVGILDGVLKHTLRVQGGQCSTEICGGNQLPMNADSRR
jgi:hypothetical protein